MRIQIETPSLELVELSKDLISSQMQEFDHLTPQQQIVVKVSSMFKAFTPSMLSEALGDASQSMRMKDIERVRLLTRQGLSSVFDE